MKLQIVGRDLPGRSFRSEGARLTNVHVGLQERREPVELVPGDASEARWERDVTVVVTDDGELDFRGPVVQGRRGERFVYLTWGDVGPHGFAMFRRAKLMLGRVDRTLVEHADRDGVLVATVQLTDERGGPRCARVDPPAIEWTTG